MKKVICLVLAIVLCTSCFTFSVFAMEGEKVEFGIVEALHAAEINKEQIGLSSVNFEQLTTSDHIYAYDFTNIGCVYNSEFIPVKYEGELIGWVIKATSDGDCVYQFSTAFVDEVNELLDGLDEFAFIYDAQSSYLYDGENLIKLRDTGITVESRAEVTEENMLNATIALSAIDADYDLEYTSVLSNARTPIYYYCDVSFVSQNPPSNICWAASAACIANCLRDTNYTAVSVARGWFGDNYNQGLLLGLQDDVLVQCGVSSYTYKNEVPSDGAIFNNIYNGYPILATFRWTLGVNGGYHDVVIYGVNAIAGYIYVMDPEFGSSSAKYTAEFGYRYVSGYSGVTLTLDRATCMYWTYS